MSLLKQLLLDKKIFDAMEEIDEFVENAGIEPGSVPQRFEFSKKVFDSVEQVDDYLLAHLFTSFKITDDDKKYLVELFDEAGFVESTMKSVVIRDGITIVVGILRPMTSDNPLLFEDEKGNIKFSADLPFIIELATTVEGFHAAFGKVELTKSHLKSFKDNFEKQVFGVDVAIDFDHETREAAGWVKEVFLSDNEETLFGVVRWTPKGALALGDREFRYFSPEFSLNWIHPHTGAEHGPTLVGGALVNRPFLKMDAIVGLTEKGAKEMDQISLSDHNAKVAGFEKQISDLKLSENTLKTTTSGLKADNVKLSDELGKLKADIEKTATEMKHKALFDSGKINAAQLTALNDGKDMIDVLALAEKMQITSTGDGGETIQVQLSDQELKLCKQLDLSHEDFIKYNKEGA